MSWNFQVPIMIHKVFFSRKTFIKARLWPLENIYNGIYSKTVYFMSIYFVLWLIKHRNANT